jgi:hypothetical protein
MLAFVKTSVSHACLLRQLADSTGYAEGAGLEPANAVTRTAVFKTAALPVMLTFQ